MFGFNYNVTLIHSSMIYVTVIAVNMAGLSSRSHSTHFIVDLTPPNVVFVNDGTGRLYYINKLIFQGVVPLQSRLF